MVDGGLNHGKLAGDVVDVESLRHHRRCTSGGYVGVVGEHLRADAPVATGQAGAYRGENDAVFQQLLPECQGTEKIGQAGANNGHDHVTRAQG